MLGELVSIGLAIYFLYGRASAARKRAADARRETGEGAFVPAA